MAQSLEAQTILDPLPVPSTPGAVGGGMMPTRYSPNISFSQPEQEIDPIEHQWRVFQSETTESGATLTVRGGKVEWEADVTADEITMAAPTTEKKIYCKITVAGETATAAEIESGDTIPEDTETEKYWLICEIFNLYPDGDFYHGIRQIQFEPIRRLGDSVGVDHPWRTVKEEGLNQWNVTGGIVYGTYNEEPTSVTVPNGQFIISGQRFIYLTITVNDRDLVAAEMTVGSVIPVDTVTTLYRELALVDGLEFIEQLAFENVRIPQSMPKGQIGEVIYHNGTKWVVLPIPESQGLHVLTYNGGVVAWTSTSECAEESPP